MSKNIFSSLVRVLLAPALVFASVAPIALKSNSAEAATTGSITIQAFLDFDGNGQYTTTPVNGKSEGTFFTGAKFEIIDSAGKPIAASNCSFGQKWVGGAGKNTCKNLPFGNYSVKFNGDTSGLTGPLKVTNNPNGANPMYVSLSAAAPTRTTEFGYQGTPAYGTLRIRIFEDKDNNGTYSNGAEGATFFNYPYNIAKLVNNKLEPVDKSRCFNGTFKVGGVGNDLCQLEPGVYGVGIGKTPDPKVFSGPIKGPNNPQGVTPTMVKVDANSTPTVDFGYSRIIVQQNKGTIHINAYVDTNWNARYDMGEGHFLAGSTYDVLDQWGKPIDYKKYCSYGDNKVGGAGRDDCTNLPSGQYQVKFHGGNPTYMVGPFKNFYNKAGLPWATIQVPSGGITTVDFGYNFKADFEVRAWVDTDGNAQFSNGEGQAFAFKTYRMWNSRGEELDYKKFCGSGDNKLGGVGRDICKGIPDGVYKIQFYGADPAKHVGPIKTSNQSGSNPINGVIYSGKMTTVDFAYTPKP